MATQMMVERNITEATSGKPYTTSAPTTPGTSRILKRLSDRMAQVYWRVSFELEPLFQGFFAPFTAGVQSCRSLSSREKAELEALMQMR